MDLASKICQRNVGPFLLNLGIQRPHLLNHELLKTLSASIELTNGMVVDLMSVSDTNPALFNKRSVLQKLNADVSSLSDPVLNRKLNNILDKYKSLKKSIHRESGQRNLNQYLAQPADFANSTVAALSQPSSRPNICTPEQMYATSQKNLVTVRRTLEEKQQELTVLKEQIKVLMDSHKEQFDRIQHLHEKLTQAEISQKMQTQLKEKQQSLYDAKTTLKQIRATNF